MPNANANSSSSSRRPRSEAFSAFYASLLLTLCAIGLWNADRLHARADMFSETGRSWTQAFIDSFSSELGRSRERSIQKALSDSFSPPPVVWAEVPMAQGSAQPSPSPAPAPSSSPAPSYQPPAVDAPKGAHAPAPAPNPGQPSPSADSTPEALSTVVFAGDSLANGYAAGGARALAEIKASTRSVDEGKISTGLVAKSYFDWSSKIQALCKKKPGAIVFSFGSNDPWDMRDGALFLKFGTPAWSEAYGARAEAIVEAAKACGAKTVWLELPPMREPGFERKSEALRKAQAKACEAADACVKPFEGMGDASETAFSTRGRFDGRDRLLRAQDGIHMAPDGYYFVARQALFKLGVAVAHSSSSSAPPSPPSASN